MLWECQWIDKCNCEVNSGSNFGKPAFVDMIRKVMTLPENKQMHKSCVMMKLWIWDFLWGGRRNEPRQRGDSCRPGPHKASLSSKSSASRPWELLKKVPESLRKLSESHALGGRYSGSISP